VVATWTWTVTLAESPAARRAIVQSTSWPLLAAQLKLPLSIESMTRRGSTLSVIRTSWAVLRAPVLVTSIVKLEAEPPAVTDGEAKVLVRSSVTSEVTSVVVVELLLAGVGSSVGDEELAVLEMTSVP